MVLNDKHKYLIDMLNGVKMDINYQITYLKMNTNIFVNIKKKIHY